MPKIGTIIKKFKEIGSVTDVKLKGIIGTLFDSMTFLAIVSILCLTRCFAYGYASYSIENLTHVSILSQLTSLNAVIGVAGLQS